MGTELEILFGNEDQLDDVNERLRHLIYNKYPKRGRYLALEEISGIGASKWKNFYHRKQNATKEMLSFWTKKYSIEAQWLLTGIPQTKKEDYPFLTKPPVRHENETIADRLIWVISEWASGSGENLFNYLEHASAGKIPASDWAKVILNKDIPTHEMVKVVCWKRPHFTEWVILGSVISITPQVDPSSDNSIKKWKEYCENDFLLSL